MTDKYAAVLTGDILHSMKYRLEMRSGIRNELNLLCRQNDQYIGMVHPVYLVSRQCTSMSGYLTASISIFRFGETSYWEEQIVVE